MFLAIALNMPFKGFSENSGYGSIRSKGDSGAFLAAGPVGLGAFWTPLAASALDSTTVLRAACLASVGLPSVALAFDCGAESFLTLAEEADCAASACFFGAPFFSKNSRHSLSTELGSLEYCWNCSSISHALGP